MIPNMKPTASPKKKDGISILMAFECRSDDVCSKFLYSRFRQSFRLM